MRAIARIVSLVALRLLRREWCGLQDELARVYSLHVDAVISHPTALAQQLLISGEDHRFFRHGGIDPIAICRAIWRGVFLGRSEGASTIEMQVVRVVSGRFERNLGRKLREMGLATLVARAIPKEDLPSVYLRIGYFGWQMNGFQDACRRIGVGPEALSAAQTAALIARLKYPQPRATRPERWNQINARAQHLLRLHSRHRCDRTYGDLVIVPTYETV